jgi:hypothetical protein
MAPAATAAVAGVTQHAVHGGAQLGVVGGFTVHEGGAVGGRKLGGLKKELLDPLPPVHCAERAV